MRVRVDEDPSQVAEAFTSAQGRPFRLTRHRQQGDVYINPAMVAFWSFSEPGPEPEPAQEVAEPTPSRDTVTDIWGKPLRRKPRR
jgi:hypothetical protein